jgi:hypothetical protein
MKTGVVIESSFFMAFSFKFLRARNFLPKPAGQTAEASRRGYATVLAGHAGYLKNAESRPSPGFWHRGPNT